MSDKAFWGAVGGVLVVVIVAFVFLVLGPAGNYNEAGTALQGRVDQLQKLAKKDPEDLPTDALVAAHEQRLEKMKMRLKSTTEFYAERDKRFESFIGGLRSPDVSTWTAQYSDANNALFERYKEHTASPGLAEAPWQGIRNAVDVLQAQKTWRALSSLVESVISIPGSRIRVCAAAQSARGLPVYDHFKVQRYRLIVDVAPSQLSTLIEKVLADDSVNFVLSSAQVVKNLNDLTPSSVEAVTPDAPDMGEPNIVARLEFDVLDWDPPKAESTE